jgi:DNA topoisomerase IB
MKKSELIKYLNENTKGRKAGRKEFRVNDIFISSSNDSKNFRLTRFGKDIIEKHFKAYKITLHSKNKETGNQILALDYYLKSPYYLSKGILILYEESIAAEILLIDGDFDLWVKNKTN